MLFKHKLTETKYFAEIITLENKVFGRDLANIYQSDEEIMVIYQVKGENLIGYMTYKDQQLSNDIYMIAVHPFHQKQGIASDLIVELQREKKNIILEVESANIPAINLYEQHGFCVVRELKNYYQGRPGLFLEWRYYDN